MSFKVIESTIIIIDESRSESQKSEGVSGLVFSSPLPRRVNNMRKKLPVTRATERQDPCFYSGRSLSPVSCPLFGNSNTNLQYRPNDHKLQQVAEGKLRRQIMEDKSLVPYSFGYCHIAEKGTSCCGQSPLQLDNIRWQLVNRSKLLGKMCCAWMLFECPYVVFRFRSAKPHEDNIV